MLWVIGVKMGSKEMHGRPNEVGFIRIEGSPNFIYLSKAEVVLN